MSTLFLTGRAKEKAGENRRTRPSEKRRGKNGISPRKRRFPRARAGRKKVALRLDKRQKKEYTKYDKTVF